MSTQTDLLVPIDRSVTLRNTVSYVTNRAREALEDGGPVSIHFVYPFSQRDPESERVEPFEDLLSQVQVWVREDLGVEEEQSLPVDISSAVIGRTEYLFSPADYSRVLVRYARDHSIEAVVLDPEYAPAGSTPLLQPLETELTQAGMDVEEAPVERQTRRSRLTTAVRPGKFFATFSISLAFYLLLGDPFYWFDLVTGTGTALLTAAVLSRVSFVRTPHFRRTFRQLARVSVYVVYLFWEIAKANVQMAYVILHPSLPIDPSLLEYEAAVWGSLPTTTLANSITLTPGTLTVDVVESHFYIHALTPSSRDGLLDGALERAVRFIFYGRQSMRIPSPDERRRQRGEEE
jgi:multicomponent Na+:H+ antiporter subunit E